MVHHREGSRPTALCQVGHTQLDIILLCEDDTVGRPWPTALIDDCTRSIPGYLLGFDAPSSLRTSLAMRPCSYCALRSLSVGLLPVWAS